MDAPSRTNHTHSSQNDGFYCIINPIKNRIQTLVANSLLFLDEFSKQHPILVRKIVPFSIIAGVCISVTLLNIPEIILTSSIAASYLTVRYQGDRKQIQHIQSQCLELETTLQKLYENIMHLRHMLANEADEKLQGEQLKSVIAQVLSSCPTEASIQKEIKLIISESSKLFFYNKSLTILGLTSLSDTSGINFYKGTLEFLSKEDSIIIAEARALIQLEKVSDWIVSTKVYLKMFRTF